jgi:hypothetical protein
MYRSRILSSFIVLFFVFALAHEVSAQQSPIHPPNGQPFMSHINDVIAYYHEFGPDCSLNAPCVGLCEGSCAGNCHSLEDSKCVNCDEAFHEADLLIAELTTKTNQKPDCFSSTSSCKSGLSCQESACPSAGAKSKTIQLMSCCSASSCSASCCSETRDCKKESHLDSSEYCQQLAVLLATTLESDASAESKQKAILTAFSMVAENARSSSSESKKLEKMHDIARQDESFQINRAFQHMLDRHSEGLKRLEIIANRNNAMLTKKVEALQRQVNNNASVFQSAHLRIDNTTLRNAQDREVERLELERERLAQRIRELMVPERRASFLEPIQTNQNLLRPIPVERR